MTDESTSAQTTTIPYEEQEIQALLRMLELSKNTFSLSVVVCEPWAREDILSKIFETFQSIATIDIPAHVEDVHAYVYEELSESTPEALFVTGLEKVIPPLEKDLPVLRALNASRELWQEFPCPIVFWVSGYIESLMISQAADFWRWFSHHFDFTQMKSENEELKSSFNVIMNNVENVLPEAERKKRIDYLRTMIDETEMPPGPALYPHVLRWMTELSFHLCMDGQIEEAEKVARESLFVVENAGESSDKLIVLGILGVALRLMREMEKALLWFEEALEFVRGTGDRRGEADTLMNIGLVYYLLGQSEKAVAQYEQVLTIAEETGDVHNEISVLHNLSTAYFDLGQVQKAVEFHKRVLNLAREIGDSHMEGIALFWAAVRGIQCCREP